MISVLTVTYNHAGSIQRAIRSVQNQYGVEIQHVIVDDGSTDGAQELIKVPHYRTCHLGMMKAYLYGFGYCKGEYIAMCDGDDYWIDSRKLYKQKAYMDQHPEVGLCIHKVITDNGTMTGMDVTTDYINQNMSFDALLRGNAFIHAQSYFIRTSDFVKYIDFRMFSDKFKLWDYPIVLTLINHTKFHCLDFYGAVYVKNSESVTNTRNRMKRLRYILGQYKIKIYFARKYGVKFSTVLHLTYRFARSIYSIIFKRWT